MRRTPTIDVGPLVDVMATCIALMLVLGVATLELQTLQVDQALVGTCGFPLERLGPPPLTVHLRARSAWIGRTVDSGVTLARAQGELDLRGLEAALDADRRWFPAERAVIVVTDDGVRYRDLVVTLDRTRAYGYSQTLLGGGPPFDR